MFVCPYVLTECKGIQSLVNFQQTFGKSLINIFDRIMDLKQFRQRNKLTQTELGEYLGIKKSFVSLIENGRVKLSEEKFNKLLNNTKGWDTSMLINGSIYAGNNNGGDVNVQIGQNRASGDARSPGDPDIASRLAVLEKENEMLRERLKDKDDQLAFLKTLINK